MSQAPGAHESGGHESGGQSREQFWLQAWYQGRWWLWLLWPLSLLFRALSGWVRRRDSSRATALQAPVIVVGNITLGGTGKTPVIIALCEYLRQQGLRPGVLSRGYGGKAPHYPYRVDLQTPAALCGDEPLLIARETGCPVVVGPDRVASAHQLIDAFGCNILLSDDGLQHYRLSRQWEICVLDGARGLGNGLCLPAGPLREAPVRLQQVDCVLVNGGAESMPVPGFQLTLKPQCWRRVSDGESRDLNQRPWGQLAAGKSLQAMTGIGNPQRFFDSLRNLGLSVDTRIFADHHPFSVEDLAYARGQALLMTAKDAVKCQSFAEPDWWYLSVTAQLPDAFYHQLDGLLEQHRLKPPVETAL